MTFRASAARRGRKGSGSAWFSFSAKVTRRSPNSGNLASTRCAALRRFNASNGAAKPKQRATATERNSTTLAAVTKPAANSTAFSSTTKETVAVKAASAAMASPRAVAPQRNRLSMAFKYAAKDSRGFMRPPEISQRRHHRLHRVPGAALQ